MVVITRTTKSRAALSPRQRCGLFSLSAQRDGCVCLVGLGERLHDKTIDGETNELGTSKNRDIVSDARGRSMAIGTCRGTKGALFAMQSSPERFFQLQCRSGQSCALSSYLGVNTAASELREHRRTQEDTEEPLERFFRVKCHTSNATTPLTCLATVAASITAVVAVV